jgi:putative transposon-encoded protein
MAEQVTTSQTPSIKKPNIFVKKAVKVGNSAGVIIPKKFLGATAKVVILNRPPETEKEIMKILSGYLKEISGIYFSDASKKIIEVLAITKITHKIEHHGKYKISLVPINLIKKDLKEKPELKEKLKPYKTIMNKPLFDELVLGK